MSTHYHPYISGHTGDNHSLQFESLWTNGVDISWCMCHWPYRKSFGLEFNRVHAIQYTCISDQKYYLLSKTIHFLDFDVEYSHNYIMSIVLILTGFQDSWHFKPLRVTCICYEQIIIANTCVHMPWRLCTNPLMHVTGSTCKTGRQQDHFTYIRSSSIVLTHDVQQIHIVFSSQFTLIVSYVIQPLCLNFGIHVGQILIWKTTAK